MIVLKSERIETKHSITHQHSTSGNTPPLSKGALAHSARGKRKQFSSSMTSYSRKSSNKQKRAARRHKHQPGAYDNPYSSDSSESRNTRRPTSSNERTRPQMRSPKRRRNSASSSAFFQSNRDILDTQLFAFIAEAEDAGSGAFEFDGLDEEEDDDEDADEDDDEDGDDEDVRDEEGDGDDQSDLDAEEDDQYDRVAEMQLSNEADGDAAEDDEQIELEEEAAIVEELSFQELEQAEDPFSELAALGVFSDSRSSSGSDDDDDDDDDELSFADTLFVDKGDPALRHIVSTAPRKYHDSDDDSFILDYFFSSGESSDDDQKDMSVNRIQTFSKRRRRQRHSTFSDDIEESEVDDENEGFELKTDEMSGIEMSVRRVANYYDGDDGESTDEDENLPPPSHRKVGHRGTEILVSSVTASKPPVLGSWVLPVGRRIGIINGLATRTLSPPPYPRGDDGEIDTDAYTSHERIRQHHDFASSPSVMAAAARNGGTLRGGARTFDRDAFGSDSEQSDVALEEFIYMSELDDDEQENLSTAETIPGPTSTPVWEGRFHSKFPLSAFRNSSSMQYRSI
ncbi:transcription factor CRF1-domain-containing protein [Lipomyces tetrasporus]|uniref:Transcription factor CRF1-domain-containing protein n=1 Tax=Lipomyces tetrasporus TaxID=54092 RepID=A0AAD7VQQ4_9ASCO|nr:transcription factor CRF1-domain-containing protein [Lipomyces tetrasporus]KAJ8098378.1 transcription factor CRF1-domain-containing protein [Lipomyces tetrasporus]